MSVVRLLASSLSLSFPVMLRMLPIFLMTGVVVFGAVSGLIEHPGYLLFVAAVAFFPLMAFLQICAIRAGLVHRRQSRGPELAKLVRKSLLLGAVQAALGLFYGILTLGAIGLTLRPQSLTEWNEISDKMSAVRLAGGSELSALYAINPQTAFALVAAFVIYSAAYIAISVPVAAHSAAAAVNGPRHEFFYGFGRRFLPLAIVYVLGMGLYLLVPKLLSTAILQSVPIDYVALLTDGVLSPDSRSEVIYLVAIAAVGIWLWCWNAAATAVAYVDVRDHIEEEHQLAMGAIRASAGPQTDLATLMRERSQRLRGYVPSVVVASEAAGFDDIDEPVGDPAPEEQQLFEDAAAEPAESLPLVLEPAPLSADEVEDRFQSRFGSEAKSSLRGDLSEALREAADLEAPPAPDERRPIEPENLIQAETPAALESEQVPPVEPDLHEQVPESDDAPEWLSKYMGQGAGAPAAPAKGERKEDRD